MLDQMPTDKYSSPTALIEKQFSTLRDPVRCNTVLTICCSIFDAMGCQKDTWRSCQGHSAENLAVMRHIGFYTKSC